MSALDTTNLWIRLAVGAGALLMILLAAPSLSRRVRYSFNEQNRMLREGRLLPSMLSPWYQQLRNLQRWQLPAGMSFIFLGGWFLMSALWPNPVTGWRAHLLGWDAAAWAISLVTFTVLALVPWWGLDKLRPVYPHIPAAADPPVSYEIDPADPTCSITVRRDPTYKGTIGLPRVLIDRHGVGKIWGGRPVRRALPPGTYRVQVLGALMRRKGSRAVEIELVPGRHVVMHVRQAPVSRLDATKPVPNDGLLLLTIV